MTEICKGKLSISSTIFLVSSAIIRILVAGCFGLAFYVKYGDKNVIGDIEFAALNVIDLYEMPLATYIQGLVFGSCTVFVTEVVCGIVGFILMAFTMLIAILFWRSGVNIHFNMSSLGERNFGIVDVLTGKVKILIANTVVIGIYILVELVSMGLQSVIENRIDDAAISVYILFTLVQVVIQVVYSTLSIHDIKADMAHNKVNNNSFLLTNNGTTRNLVEEHILTETNLD